VEKINDLVLRSTCYADIDIKCRFFFDVVRLAALFAAPLQRLEQHWHVFCARTLLRRTGEDYQSGCAAAKRANRNSPYSAQNNAAA
jgi:hypothetical protein